MSLRAVIVSRADCFKCKDIQETLAQENVDVTVLLWGAGGQEYLVQQKHVPLYLPTTFLYHGDRLVFTADGLAQFQEKWEEYIFGG